LVIDQSRIYLDADRSLQCRKFTSARVARVQQQQQKAMQRE
jgi:hypothetical protein